MDIYTEYEFIKDLWKFMKENREFKLKTYTEGDKLINKHKEVPYALDMVKAYLDHIETEGK